MYYLNNIFALQNIHQQYKRLFSIDSTLKITYFLEIDNYSYKTFSNSINNI